MMHTCALFLVSCEYLMLQGAPHALSAPAGPYARLQVSLVCAIRVQGTTGAQQCAAPLPKPGICDMSVAYRIDYPLRCSFANQWFR